MNAEMKRAIDSPATGMSAAWPPARRQSPTEQGPPEAIPATNDNTPRPPGGLPVWRLRRAKRYLEDNLADEISVTKAARLSGLSQSHFARAFKASTGTPPYRWVLQARIRRAQVLLAEGGYSLASISVEVGFSDQSHFTRTFKRLTGKTPGRWLRNRSHQQQAGSASGRDLNDRVACMRKT
jgi:AraC-like DNA-binding protein